MTESLRLYVVCLALAVVGGLFLVIQAARTASASPTRNTELIVNCLAEADMDAPQNTVFDNLVLNLDRCEGR